MHVNGDLRNDFIAAVENCQNPRKMKVSKETLEALFECTDIMPSGICDNLDLKAGATFAEGVHAVTLWQTLMPT